MATITNRCKFVQAHYIIVWIKCENKLEEVSKQALNFLYNVCIKIKSPFDSFLRVIEKW